MPCIFKVCMCNEMNNVYFRTTFTLQYCVMDNLLRYSISIWKPLRGIYYWRTIHSHTLQVHAFRLWWIKTTLLLFCLLLDPNALCRACMIYIYTEFKGVSNPGCLLMRCKPDPLCLIKVSPCNHDMRWQLQSQIIDHWP